MRGWMAGLKHVMPSFHLGVVQADLLEHSDPLLYVYSIFHYLNCVFMCCFSLTMAMTEMTLNREAVDGSTVRCHFFLLGEAGGDFTMP